MTYTNCPTLRSAGTRYLYSTRPKYQRRFKDVKNTSYRRKNRTFSCQCQGYRCVGLSRQLPADNINSWGSFGRVSGFKGCNVGLFTGIRSANFSLMRWASLRRFAACVDTSFGENQCCSAHTESQQMRTERVLFLERLPRRLRHLAHGIWNAQISALTRLTMKQEIRTR